MSDISAIWHMAHLKFLADQGDDLAKLIFEQTAEDVINNKGKRKFFEYLTGRLNAADKFTFENSFGPEFVIERLISFGNESEEVNDYYDLVWNAAHYVFLDSAEDIDFSYLETIPVEVGDEDPYCQRLQPSHAPIDFRHAQHYLEQIDNEEKFALCKALVEREGMAEKFAREFNNKDERIASVRDMARALEYSETEDVWNASMFAARGKVDASFQVAFDGRYREKVESGKKSVLFDVLVNREDALYKFGVEGDHIERRNLARAAAEFDRYNQIERSIEL
ncbi:MAG: hypothetical protein LBG48_04865 [Rickettsiales bacterium]|jgi:hypothetical protein|nr:hypothetical protein [Rickettsiales bacterium]